MTRSIVYVFLASPGGLERERQLARLIVDEINRIFADRTNWQVELLGWEDTLPGYGRPQDHINRDVDRSDLFVGLLHKRWGQPTGNEYTSGFHEEFDRALQRRRGSGAPEIMLLFKKIDDVSDPGDQLQRVLQFKEEQVRNKELFFREIADELEWTGLLREWLTRAILDRLSGTQQESPPSSPAPPEGESTPPADDDLRASVPAKGESQPLPSQIARVIERIDRLGKGDGVGSFEELIDSIESSDIVRLDLAMRAAVARRLSTDVLGVHEANRVYRHRNEFDLAFSEELLLLRSLVSDKSNVIPGWFWLGSFQHPVAVLRYLATQDGDENVRAGAISLLDVGGTLAEESGSELIALLLRDESPAVRREVLDFLRRRGSPADLTVIQSVIEPATSGDSALKEAATFVRARTNPEQAFEELLSQTNIRNEVIETVALKARELDPVLLKRALSHDQAELRSLAAVTLLQTANLTESEARTLTKDSYRLARAIGYVALSRLGFELPLEEVSTAVAPPADPSGGFGSLLIGRSAPTFLERFDQPDSVLREIMRTWSGERLYSSIEWFGHGSLAYQVMAVRHFNEYQEQIRTDLDEGFERIRKAYESDIVTKFGQPLLELFQRQETRERVDRFTREEFAAAALKGVARHGSPTDINFGRQYLDAQADFTRRAALEVIARFGNSEDVEGLLTLASRSYGRLKERALETALVLGRSTRNDPILMLLHSNEELMVRVAIRELIERPTVEYKEQITALLHHEHETVRTLAIAYLVRRARDELEMLLDEYPEERISYYYNVIVWLDRILYAPSAFAGAFVARLDQRVAKKERI